MYSNEYIEVLFEIGGVDMDIGVMMITVTPHTDNRVVTIVVPA
jgi:hypothetical protein